MSNWTKEDLDKVKATIGAKAAFDKAFREEVLANPAAMIEKIAGKKIPEGYSVDIIENKPGTVATFVLPNYYGDKIGQEELAAIAGARSVTATNTAAQVEVAVQVVEAEEVVSTTTTVAEAELAVGAVVAVVAVEAVVLV